MPNTTYKVIVTRTAQFQLEQIINYIILEFADLNAARSIHKEALEVLDVLSHSATSHKIIDCPDLVSFKYRTIKFSKHKYIAVYRIEENTVIIEGIFHGRQDYYHHLMN